MTFDAWQLPDGVALPDGGPGLSFSAGEVDVHYPEATAAWIRALARTLQDGREELLARPAVRIAESLGRVGERFLEDGDPLRTEALRLLPHTAGLSPEMASAVLDGMAYGWTADRLAALLEADLAGGEALDGFVDTSRGRVRAVGPALCVQVASGSVPGVGATALLRSLLVKAPTLLKPGRGDLVLPVLAARGIREADPVLAAALAVVYWPGGSEALEAAALLDADVVTAYGDSHTVRSLRARTPVSARFVPYHNRISLGIVGREALVDAAVRRAASDVAGAVAFFDQRGCVSPHVVYVEEGGQVDPPAFARRLAGALQDLEGRLPGGTLDAREASALQQVRGTAELMAGSDSGVEVRHGGDADWTVIYDPAPAFAPSCVGRVVRVKPVPDVSEVPRLLRPFRPNLQTVGVAGCGDRLEALADALVRVGVIRIAPFDAVPFPPPWWHHDGVGPLRALVRWVDLEG